MANMLENFHQEAETPRATTTLGPTDTYTLALSDQLLDEPSEPAGVMALLIEVLQSLNHMHSRGLVHSPLTPSSIKLTREGRVQIESESPADPSQTIAFRSTKYSAPDAFQKVAEAASCEPLDSYLLGFMFYELSLGRRLFNAEFADVAKGKDLGWLTWHADKSRSARLLSDVLPSVPASISRMIAGMMEKDPARRVTDLKQLLATVQKATEATVLLPEAKVRESATSVQKREEPKSFWRSRRSNSVTWSQKPRDGQVSGNAPGILELVDRTLQRAAASPAGRFVASHGIYVFAAILTLAVLVLLVIRWM
jgi:serine/threonine protein kinase